MTSAGTPNPVTERAPLPAPVAAIGKNTCRNAQRVVTYALAERGDHTTSVFRKEDLTAARQVLDILGLSFKIACDDSDAESQDVTLLWHSGVDSVLSRPEPHAKRKWQAPAPKER